MWKRLLALVSKELQVILGDRSGRMLLVVPVLLQITFFAFAATMEVRDATLAVCSRDAGPESAEVLQRLTRTPAFGRVLRVSGEAGLRAALDGQQALVAVYLPMDFSRRVAAREPAAVQVLVDGRRSNSGQIAAGYVAQVLRDFARDRGDRAMARLALRDVYNPNLDFKWHVLPSLVAIITTIGSLVVTGLSVAREREEGTFEQLLVSPLTPAYIMAGKAIPGVLVAVVQGTFIALAAVWVFGVPFTGSAPVLLLGMVCYGLALTGVGLSISSVSMTQQQAFLGVFTFTTPAVLLSGYVAPIENMPRPLQWLAQADPLTHFIRILKGVFLKGYGLPEVWPSLWPLLLIALATLAVALGMFRRHIA